MTAFGTMAWFVPSNGVYFAILEDYMNSIKNTVMAGLLVVSSFGVTPVLADHDDHHNNGYHNGHDHDWDRRDINVRVNDNHYNDRHYQNQAVSNDWNSQRTLYRNNWKRISRERQQALDAQMRAQWLAYHHNNWNGDYNWDNYNNPQFLDYLHTSNPGLLNTLRSYIGF
jgi:hypothetical protein